MYETVKYILYFKKNLYEKLCFKKSSLLYQIAEISCHYYTYRACFDKNKKNIVFAYLLIFYAVLVNNNGT